MKKECLFVCLVVVAAMAFASPRSTAQISPNDYYGSGIVMDGIGNFIVAPVSGGYPEIDYRFRATQSGSLTQIWAYLITSASGYAAGTGGTLVLQLRTDDGTIDHLPTSTVLGTASLANAFGKPSFSPFDLSPVPSLTAGTIYHLVWSNSDPNPTQNYVSLDMVYEDVGTSPAQPTIRPEDLDNLALNGSTWIELVPPNTFNNHGYTPIANLIYSNGATQGLGYIEALISSRKTISGTSAVSETFTVTGPNCTVVRVSTRARRTGGTGGNDPLRIQFVDSGGSTINDCYVPASHFPLNVDTYATCAFTSAYTLQSGNTYRLDLEASSTTVYDTLSIENAAHDSWNFGSGTTFPDGHAEYEVSGSGWTPWDGRLDTDLEFYFTLQ